MLLSDKLNYADSVINKVTSMQKQREADTYVWTRRSAAYLTTQVTEVTNFLIGCSLQVQSEGQIRSSHSGTGELQDAFI